MAMIQVRKNHTLIRNPLDSCLGFGYLSFWLCISISLVWASLVWAQPGQDIFLANAKALSLGHAVTADPPGIDSIHFNPAGLAKLRDLQFEFKGVYADVSLTGQFQSSPEYDRLLSIGNFHDQVSGSNSKINGITIFLPKAGLVDLPAAAAGMGGISWESKKYGITFADAVYAPLAGGVNRDDDDPGRYSYRRVGVTRLTYFSPSFGVYLTDTLAVGASLGASYFGVGDETDVRFPNTILGGFENVRRGLCGAFGLQVSVCAGSLDPTQPLASIELAVQDPLSLTFNLGVLWEPTDWFSWGAAYQSGARDKLRGTLKLKYSEGTRKFLQDTVDSVTVNGRHPNINTKEQTLKTTIDFPYPQHFSTGISVKVVPQWKFNMDLKWTETSVWDQWTIRFDEPVDILALAGPILSLLGAPGVSANQVILPRGYQDAWNLSFGVEHQLNDQLVLRMGYEPRKSHIPDNKRDFIVPLGDVDIYGMGLGYRPTSDTDIDLALALIKSHQYIPSDTSDNANSLNVNNFIYNPYAGQNITTDLNVSLFLLSYRTRF